MSLQRLLLDYDSELFESNVQETSRQSLKELGKEEIAQRHQEILNGYWRFGRPATDQELSNFLGHADPNYVRPRRFELENELGLVIECNPRECSITHRMAKTFWPIGKGLELIR